MLAHINIVTIREIRVRQEEVLSARHKGEIQHKGIEDRQLNGCRRINFLRQSVGEPRASAVRDDVDMTIAVGSQILIEGIQPAPKGIVIADKIQ